MFITTAKRIPSTGFRSLNILEKLVISLPVLNVLADFSVQLLGRDSFHLGLVRAFLLFTLVIIILIMEGLKEKVTRRLVTYLVFLFILILLSSDFTYSFTDTYLKVFISMLMFPVCFYVVNSYHKMILFLKSLVLAGLLLCLNYSIAQIFTIGRSVYLDDSFYYGYAGIGSTVVLSYLLITAPVLFRNYRRPLGKWLFRMLLFLSILFTILALKRIAILSLITGYLVFLLVTRKFGKGFRYIILVIILLAATSPLYLDMFKERLEARPTQVSELDEEQRYYDLIYAINDFRTRGLKHALIGTETFNSPGYFGRNRQVHVDYANLLIGTGLIGLLFYFYIYFSIYNRFRRSLNIITRNHIYSDRLTPEKIKDIRGVFLALLVASLIVSFSGGLHVITTRSILFSLLGIYSGLLFNQSRFVYV